MQSANTFTLEGWPASPHSGSRNFLIDETGVVRFSEDGAATAESSVVPETEGDPAGSPHPAMGMFGPCSVDPFLDPGPTNPAQQAVANKAASQFAEAVTQDIVSSFAGESGPNFLGGWFSNQDAASLAVQPDRAVLEALDTDQDDAIGFHEVASPQDTGWIGNAISNVEGAYGSCEALCEAAGETAPSCASSCTESIPAQQVEVEDLAGQVPATLPFTLDLGIACEQEPPGVPISSLVDLSTNGPRVMQFITSPSRTQRRPCFRHFPWAH